MRQKKDLDTLLEDYEQIERMARHERAKAFKELILSLKARIKSRQQWIVKQRNHHPT
ncbi:RSP_7527 family protein [Eionea flava]